MCVCRRDQGGEKLLRRFPSTQCFIGIAMGFRPHADTLYVRHCQKLQNFEVYAKKIGDLFFNGTYYNCKMFLQNEKTVRYKIVLQLKILKNATL